MDDGRISGRDPFWVQMTMMAIVMMLERVGLQTKMSNTKAISCTPVFIWGQQGAADYKRRATCEGSTFWERNITRVSSTECG